MKRINSLFSALLFLYSLTGCSLKEGEGCGVPFGPEIIIIYTDTDGNVLKREISTKFEILSVINSEGDSLRYYPTMYKDGLTGLDMYIGETFTNLSPKTERLYTVRYKVTLNSDEERKEELRLVYSKDFLGTFTEAWYNGSRMKEISTPIFIFDGTNPVAGFDGTASVAVMLSDMSLAYLIIPVE
jgi:hypothetical protein